jgi:hypothetical protein
MINLNAKLVALSAALAVVLSSACGTAPAGPSSITEVLSTPVATSTLGSQTTAVRAPFTPAPSCGKTKLILSQAQETAGSALVTSNYVTTKQCASLTWAFSTKAELVAGISNLGTDQVKIYAAGSNKESAAPVVYTLQAFGPNGMTASINVVLP